MRQWLASALALALWAVSSLAAADPIVVERVVARVDGRPILLSELSARARPLLSESRAVPAWRRAQALRRVLKTLLDQRIDEELLADMARQRALAVSDTEVESAIVRIAKDNQMSVSALFAGVLAVGYSERGYRDEIKRQLLAQKVLYREADERHLRSPDGEAVGAWSRKLMKRILSDARRGACVERLVRF